MKDFDGAEIDAILEEFGARTEDRWDPIEQEYCDSNSYIIAMTKGMDNSQLFGLAAHLGIETQNVDVSPVPEFWGQNRLRIFISHLFEHKLYAKKLQKELSIRGMTAFVAHVDIKPNAEWLMEIERALRTCDALVALLHPNFNESAWTDHEVGFALGRDVPVFGVDLGVTPYGLIGKNQAFKGAGKSEQEVAIQLFHSMRSNPQTSAGLADFIANMFLASGDLAKASERFDWLENLPNWKKGLSNSLVAGLESNEIIGGDTDLSGRVLDLVRKHEPEMLPPESDFDSLDDEIPF